MIEHKPWIVDEYQIGIHGQKIGIVGYSHHNTGPDRDEFTRDTIQLVMRGERRLQFYTKIRNYFGCGDHKAFWPHVLFFNYLPNLIGGPDARHARGSRAQHEGARDRFMKNLARYKPDKIFVFTIKGWSDLTGGTDHPISPGIGGVSWRTWVIDGHQTAFGLRHPQFANSNSMKHAVRSILDLSERQTFAAPSEYWQE